MEVSAKEGTKINDSFEYVTKKIIEKKIKSRKNIDLLAALGKANDGKRGECTKC